MKTAKRSISILLLLSIILSFTAFAEEASPVQTENSASIDENARLCMDLGLISEDEYPDGNAFITKEDFLAMVSGLVGIDAKKNSYKSIVNAYSYFAEFKDGEPEGFVSFGSAARILVTIAGYEQIALNKGADTESYFSEAYMLGIARGINKAANERITYSEAAKMLVNTFDVEYLDYEGTYDDGNAVLEADGETVLNALLDIYEGSGQVTATSITGLYSSDGAAGKNNVSIDGVGYSTEISCIDYIGINVDFYYRDTEDELKILHITPEEEWLKVNTEDFENASLEVVEYNDGDKTRTKRIADDALYFYNGVAAPDMTKEDINNANGYVIFDTAGTKTATVVSVWDFYSVCVYLYQHDEDRIIDIDRKQYEIIQDDYDEVIITDPDGNKMFMVDIKFGCTLSVAEGKDKRLLKIIISQEKIQGTVVSVYDGNKIIVNEKEYRISKEFLNSGSEAAQKLEAGAVGTFHVDAFGNIVNIEWSSDGYLAGYLIKGFYNEDTERVTLKILTASGTIEEVICSENISVDAQKKTGKAIVTALQYQENGETKIDGMIRYRLRKNGEVTQIDTPYFKDPNTGDITDLELGETEDSLRLMFAEAKRYYKKSQYLIGGVIPLVQETLIFNVPGDVNSAKDIDFSVSPYTGMGGEASYMVAGYTIGDSIVSKYVVKPTAGRTEYACIKDEFIGINEDDEVCTYITMDGYYGSKFRDNVTYEVEAESLLDGFELGDYVQLEINAAEVIIGVTPIYRWKSDSLVKSVGTDGKDVLWTRNPTHTSYVAAGRYAAGTPLKIEQDFMQIECADPQTPSTLLIDYSAPAKFKIVVVEEDKHSKLTVKRGTINDIKTKELYGSDCSKIFYHTSYGDPKVMIVYN